MVAAELRVQGPQSTPALKNEFWPRIPVRKLAGKGFDYVRVNRKLSLTKTSLQSKVPSELELCSMQVPYI
jgi:hypothetical protein